jgi:hypothetical protein
VILSVVFSLFCCEKRGERRYRFCAACRVESAGALLLRFRLLRYRLVELKYFPSLSEREDAAKRYVEAAEGSDSRRTCHIESLLPRHNPNRRPPGISSLPGDIGNESMRLEE